MKQFGLILTPAIGYTFMEITDPDELPFTDVLVVSGDFVEQPGLDSGMTTLYVGDQPLAQYNHTTRVLTVDPDGSLGLLPHFNTHFLQGQIAYQARANGFLKD